MIQLAVTDTSLLLLAAVGAASGFVAGLVGLAGGIVIVPALTWLYGLGALHAAIVISWFSVLFNSLGAATKQWRVRSPQERRSLVHGARWYLAGVTLIAPAVSLVASHHQDWVTPRAVAVLQLCLAVVMFWPLADAQKARRAPPALDLSAGGAVAAVSTLIGVGGGTYTIAYLVYASGMRFRDAIATANMMGLAIGVLSVTGFVAGLLLTGDGVAGQLGPMSPAGMVAVVVSGALCAPMGVVASRAMPVRTLRNILVGALALSAVRMLVA